MSPDDRFPFVLSAVLAATVVLGLSQIRRPVVGGVPDPPMAGRAESTLPVGPVGPLAAGPAAAAVEEPDEDALLAQKRVQALFQAHEWPAFARLLVIHPLAGSGVGGEGLEQGPPYHVVVAEDGSVAWTPRGESAAPSQPPGIPAHAAVRALHVALPAADRAGAGRIASVRALWREAARRLGDRGALFADEVPESTARIPEGFDRSAWVAPQESRATATRPRAPATRPESRPNTVRVGFGSITLQCGVVATFASRGVGLMGRKSLAADEGLLFVYRSPDPRSYWMKDCLIPLDIIYLKDDGEVISVTTAPPPDPKVPEADLPRYPSHKPCRLVLEVAGGLAAKSGVKAGSKLALPPEIERLFEKADP